jgi:hypothetical protein
MVVDRELHRVGPSGAGPLDDPGTGHVLGQAQRIWLADPQQGGQFPWCENRLVEQGYAAQRLAFLRRQELKDPVEFRGQYGLRG